MGNSAESEREGPPRERNAELYERDITKRNARDRNNQRFLPAHAAETSHDKEHNGQGREQEPNFIEHNSIKDEGCGGYGNLPGVGVQPWQLCVFKKRADDYPAAEHHK